MDYLLGCKFSLDNALEVKPERLLESLRIGVLHGRVVAVHVVAREAALLPTHLVHVALRQVGGIGKKLVGWKRSSRLTDIGLAETSSGGGEVDRQA